MKTILVEDEHLNARRLEKMLLRHDADAEVLAILPSVEAATEWLSQHPEPDLVFMDIHLEDDLAFRIFERIPLQAPVIFTTAYDESMIRAFRANNIDFLLKPVNNDELARALEKCREPQSRFARPNLDVLLECIVQKDKPGMHGPLDNHLGHAPAQGDPSRPHALFPGGSDNAPSQPRRPVPPGWMKP